MKAKDFQAIMVVAAAVCASIISGNAQQFQNLNFESPLINTYATDQFGDELYQIPNWTAAIGSSQISVATSSGGLLDQSDVYVNTASPIDGTTSINLGSVYYLASRASVSISQTGLVPQNAQSIQFRINNQRQNELVATPMNPLEPQMFLTMNGQACALNLVSNDGSYYVLGANIGTFAGQTATLTIGANATGYSVEFGATIDDVAFSSVAVPEPSSLTMVGVGIGSMLILGGRKIVRPG